VRYSRLDFALLEESAAWEHTQGTHTMFTGPHGVLYPMILSQIGMVTHTITEQLQLCLAHC